MDMIASIFHAGSGLGNQLHRYVMARVLALDKGVDFGVISPENFKGKSFMNIDLGKPVTPAQMVKENHKAGYNDLSKIPNEIIIDGEWQGEKYWDHRRKEVDEWLKVESLDMPDDLCVIGFRGGEYATVPELFLSNKYWDKGIKMMLKKNPDMRFVVHTDDIPLARSFFSEYPCIHDIGLNWRSVRYAKHLIIANSSFYIFPAWLNENTDIIAPRYWARPYGKEWVLPYNKYKGWKYITCQK